MSRPEGEVAEPMPEANGAMFMGGRNEMSLGNSAVEHWLEADPEHFAVATVRHKDSQEYARGLEETHGERYQWVRVDWIDDESIATGAQGISDMLNGRQIQGLVHAIAGGIDMTSFKTSSSEANPATMLQTFQVSAVSLLSGVQVAKEHMAEGSGVATFSFGLDGRHIKRYGAAMSVAKAGLRQLATELHGDLSGSDIAARFAIINTGLIPSLSGSAVPRLQEKIDGKRIDPIEAADKFAEMMPLANADYMEQLASAGLLAADFIRGDRPYGQIAMQEFDVDGGFRSMTPDIF